MDSRFEAKPGEQTIVLDNDNGILYSDFEPLTPSETPHLLDFLDEAKDLHILRLVGVALDRREQVVSANVTFRGERRLVRVVASGEEPSKVRLFFGPGEIK